MAETSPKRPVDLSEFDHLDPLPPAVNALTTGPTSETRLTVVADERLLPQPRLDRLVGVANLSPEDFTAANSSAANLDFRNTNTLLAHGDGVLAGLAQTSRQLLTGVRLGEADEVGRIAAAVIDGVK